MGASRMCDVIENSKVMPVLMLRGLVMFPKMVLQFEVGRKRSIVAIEEAMSKDQRIFLVTQKDIKKDNPGKEDLYEIGIIANVRQILQQPGNMVKVIVEGKKRARLDEIISDEPYYSGSASECESVEPETDIVNSALIRKTHELFGKYLSLSPKMAPDLILGVKTCRSAGELADYIASNIMLDFTQKQIILEELNSEVRLEKLLEILANEIDILGVENDLAYRLKDSVDKSQKEIYLREQMKAIAQELGEDLDPQTEADMYKEKIAGLSLEKDVEQKLMKECDRFSKMSSGSPEANVARNYLDTCLELPWNKRTRDSINIDRARKVLDKDHFGLKDVKERILELLAVRKLSKKPSAQIICLSGPPGVGKTSIARSMANAMGKKYVRISLGGVKDESEIRGHRRTYIGSMPGRIIAALKQAGTKNPLILLDEIDKLSKDYQGDPTAALLEVLDPEQNRTFQDHYIDVPFDLSEVLFITTANDKSAIPTPLLDRMEIIDLYSYTHEEKFNIAKNHLIPKQLKANGLTESKFSITDAALRKLIDGFTKEAGVRSLERKIASLMRKVAVKILSKEVEKYTVDESNLEKLLGPVKYKDNPLEKKSEIGLVRGLAWTSVGGETMPIEVALMKGKGKLQLTGSLGDVMKESAQIAVSYVRNHAKSLEVNPDFYDKTDIHIHASEGAVPKDGPSAGVTMTTALVSALSQTPVKQDVAMTGEITLRGKVLPIGGLKEKTMAAYRAGIKTVIIPAENESDLKEIDDVVKNSLKFVMAEDLNTVFEYALDKSNLKKKNTGRFSSTSKVQENKSKFMQV